MSDIAYQNKDIVSKIFGHGLKEKSLEVYGIPMSRVVNVLPVNLPAIEASELNTDNLFELEDHSVALIDYESQYTELSKLKYINHIARFLKRYGAGSPTGKTRIKTASKRPKPGRNLRKNRPARSCIKSNQKLAYPSFTFLRLKIPAPSQSKRL